MGRSLPIAVLLAIALAAESGCGITQAQLRARAVERERQRQEQLSGQIEEGRQLLSQHRPQRALPLFEKALKAGASEPVLPYLIGEAVRSASVTEAVLSEHRGAVIAVAVSPDGHRLFTADEMGTARTWDRESAKRVSAFPCEQGAIRNALLSADGRRFLSIDGKVACVVEIAS